MRCECSSFLIYLQKLSRKLVHTLAGPGFLACWPLFGNAPYSRLIASEWGLQAVLQQLVLH